MSKPPLRDHRSSFARSLLIARMRSPPWQNMLRPLQFVISTRGVGRMCCTYNHASVCALAVQNMLNRSFVPANRNVYSKANAHDMSIDMSKPKQLMLKDMVKNKQTSVINILTAMYSSIIMVSVGCKQAPQNCTMLRSKLTLLSNRISCKASNRLQHNCTVHSY